MIGLFAILFALSAVYDMIATIVFIRFWLARWNRKTGFGRNGA